MSAPSAPGRPATVLLDLDGTLVDSAPGILGSLQEAFAELDVPLPPDGLPHTLLGPPLYVTLPRLVGDDVAPALIAAYRRIYGDRGLLTCPPFAGIDALLDALSEAGVRLAVATSKAEVYAERIVAHRGWTEVFATVCGDTLDGQRPTKAHVVGEALRRLGDDRSGDQGPGDHGPIVMVGDRLHDVVGAREHGIDCLGVGWGYAAPGELEEAGAVAVYGQIGELQAALLG
ncbi:MAG: phosphoglycolate phosphatase [Pseudonocardiales bacterium]|nr:phosphoglycolate phosphatase [Pseudonocardiales bacterium]